MTASTPYLLPEGIDERPEKLAGYRARGGYAGFERALELAPEEIVAEVERAGLRGRGGAAFPTGRKWRLALERDAAVKHVVANGGEHEPGSRKDRTLLEQRPHLVLEGLLIACRATGASQCWIYVCENLEAALASVRTAVAELEAEGLAGGPHSRSGVTLHVFAAPATYVAGEETAVIDAIDGGEGKPRGKPPYPAECGIGGAPTTVNNVETLAHAAAVLRFGAERFASIGTAESTGTVLLTLGEEFARPGVHEVPFGTSWRALFEEHGGGLRSGRRVAAFLPSMSSAWVPGAKLDTEIAHEALAALGSSLGCGGVHLLEEGADPLPFLVEHARFFATAQCGQCPPCNMVTAQVRQIFEGLARGREGDFEGALERLALFAKGRGRCSLIAMDLAPALSGARLFARELPRPERSG